MSTFHRTSGAESPAGTALALVFDRCDSTLIAPVHAARHLCVKKLGDLTVVAVKGRRQAVRAFNSAQRAILDDIVEDVKFGFIPWQLAFLLKWLIAEILGLFIVEQV